MRIILVILTLLISAAAYSNGVGNGGDPLRLRFEEARSYTVERIQNATACSFNVDVKPEVISWIMSHQANFALDVQSSPHNWITDAQATCAFTQTKLNAPITLSFDACRPGIRDVNDAIQILAHESVHHFGITDENFADQVGWAIARLGQQCSCSPTPATNPFDPNSCPGQKLSKNDLYHMIPLPQSNSKILGQFNASIRQRRCYGPKLCTSWELVHGQLKGYNYVYNYAHSQTGTVTVSLKGNQPEIDILSKPVPSYSGGPAVWGSENMVDDNYHLTSSHIYSGLGSVYLGNTDIEHSQVSIEGWITNTCLRQTRSVSTTGKDSQGNDVTDETEMVILSKF